MRSIFWIGCVLTVLVSLLVSGAFAESVNNSTVTATDALDVNMTALPAQEATSVNVTEEAGNVTNVTAADVSTTEPDLVNDTLVKFVNDARTFALNSGKTAALATFNSPTGQFSNDKMYIFAYDDNGKALALPYDMGSVGKNMISTTDSTGLRYVQQMCDVAKTPGVGFVKYQESNPMNKGEIMNKVSYIANVDGTYFIGAGVYQTEEDMETPSEAEVTAIKVTESATNATMPAEIPAVPAVEEAVNTTASNLTA